MDMLAAGPTPLGLGGPCQRRDVREWQHMDPLTGDRLRARLEADRWIVGQTGRYDKVVDSRDVTAADGRLRSQHKQMEVLQARTARGSVQVVRSRTVSSARWSSNCEPTPAHQDNAVDYDSLQLMVHPLDLSTQRDRAGIGRSGSIATRRPPTRLRDMQPPQQPTAPEPQPQPVLQPVFHNEPPPAELHRSNSTEDLSSLEKYNDEYEQVGEWRRVSKIRRSLQFHGKTAPTVYKPPPPDLPDTSGCVSKIRRELESCANGANAPKAASSPKAYVKPKRHSFITMDSLQEVRGRLRKASDERDQEEEEHDDGIVVRTDDSETDAKATGGRVRSYVYGMEAASGAGTGSLESRRARDTEDWHARRKSYGFEGVLAAAPVSAAMVRSDTSTDSGICRSTELTNAALYEGRATVVTLGKGGAVTTIPISNGHQQYYRQPSDEREDGIIKREPAAEVNGSADNEEDPSGVGRRSKKVEFCKTEVHFAADSGRVNIVETDGKPPPTQNFRRRRRVTAIGTVNPETKANLPVVHFGDNEQNQLASDTNGTGGDSTVVKVKPVRPRSFHMGEAAPPGTGDSLWGVRLRHVAPVDHPTIRIEPPVTPAPAPAHDPDPEPLAEENAWSSVAERIRAVEDRKNRGFSTKVNFGSGETIVENRASVKERQKDEPSNTTTKISIDLSPSPAFTGAHGCPFSKLSNTGGVLKSTSLIMRTIHTNDPNNPPGPVPAPAPAPAPPSAEQLFSQLNQLRRLYEADSDDSARADEEVKGYLTQMHQEDPQAPLPATAPASDVPSGSWSRIRTYRQQNIINNNKHFREDQGRMSQDWNVKQSEPVKPRNGVISVSYVECNSEVVKKISTTHIGSASSSDDAAAAAPDPDKLTPPELCQMPSIIARKDSLRRSLAGEPITKTSVHAKLARSASPRAKSPRPNSPLLETSRSKFKREKSPNKDIRKSRSPVKTPITPSTISSSSVTPSSVTPLTRGTRQLREHELSYFGVKVNKKTSDNGHVSSVKPDLLRHGVRTSPNRSKPAGDKAEYVNLPVTRSHDNTDQNHPVAVKRNKNRSPEKESKGKETHASPIYQNLHAVKKPTPATCEVHDFNDLSLDEFTKAADEILQAISDYGDDEGHSLPSESNEFSPPITETPKRGDKRLVEEKGIQVSRSHREGQRRHHKSSSSKGSSLLASSKADSTERPRASRRRAKDVAEAGAPLQNGVSSSGVQPESPHKRSNSGRRHHHHQQLLQQRAGSREALLEATAVSSDEDRPPAHDANLIIRRHRRRERSTDRSTVIPEYHHKTVTSTIRSVAEKAAAKSSKKHSERHKGSTKQGRSLSGARSSGRALNETKRFWK